jgi:hypothetical protein
VLSSEVMEWMAADGMWSARMMVIEITIWGSHP